MHISAISVPKLHFSSQAQPESVPATQTMQNAKGEPVPLKDWLEEQQLTNATLLLDVNETIENKKKTCPIACALPMSQVIDNLGGAIKRGIEAFNAKISTALQELEQSGIIQKKLFETIQANQAAVKEQTQKLDQVLKVLK